MARRFISIKPIDQMGEKPDRPSDEVLWEDLQNVWFDVGVLKKRPAMSNAAFSTGIETASPAHVIVQYEHPSKIDADATLRPTGAGSNTAWTKSGAATNWQCVDDIITTDSDYVYADTTLEKDSYGFANTTLTVLDKLTLSARVRRDPVEAYTLTFFCRTAGGVEKDIGDAVTIPKSTTGSYQFEVFTLDALLDPQTSAVWTAANVNAYQFGYYATFATHTLTEYLTPSGDGSTYSQWDKQGGATYNAILSGNSQEVNDAGAPSTWTDYVYTNVDSEKFGVTFGPTVNTFSSITSITPIVYYTTLLGGRQLKLRLKDNGNEEIFLTRGYGVTKAPRVDYDEYIGGTFVPKLISWYASSDYTTDPLTDAVFDPATAFTYEWILGTTTYARSDPFRKKLLPDTITSTDWVMVNETEDVSGSLSGTPSGLAIRKTISWNGSEYVAYVTANLPGTFTGTITTDNLSIAFSESVTIAFDGEVRGASINSLSGTLTAVPQTYQVSESDANGTIDGRFSVSAGTVAVTFTNQVWNTAASASVALTPLTGTSIPFLEYDNSPDVSSLDTDVWGTTPGAYPILLRNDTYPGTFPLKIGFANLPSLNYNLISQLGVALYQSDYIVTQPPVVGVSPANLIVDHSLSSPASRLFTIPHGAVHGYTVQKKNLDGEFNETNVNAETIDWNLAALAAGTWVSIKGVTRRVMFTAHPEELIYSFELKVLGEAGPRPAVSQFFIELEGATSTNLRISKLLVTQTDFYRWTDTGTALTDIVDAATAPTGYPGLRWDTTKFFGKQYFTNGKDEIYRYPSATNKMEEMDIEQAYTISSFIGRLFMGHTTESNLPFPDRVRWSAVGDDSDWTGTGSGFLDLDDTDGDVVKLEPLGGVLVAYKETSLYNLSPTGDRDDAIVKQLISPGIGAAAGSSVLSVVARDGLPAHIFLGRGRGGFNVYMYTGNMVIPIGDDIKEELRDNLHAWHYRNCFSIVDSSRNQYLLFTPYKTLGPRAVMIWTYDIDTGSWKSWKSPYGITCAGWWETREAVSNVREWTLLLGQADSTVKWLDPELYEDEGSFPITMIAESGDWAVSPRVKYATLYRLNIHHYDTGYTPIRVSVSTDGGDTYTTEQQVYLGQADGSADGSLQLAQADLMTTGRRFRIKLVHDDNSAIEISELVMEIQDQGWIV